MSAPVPAETVTFVMAGCQRCGTTWVDAALREHPEIYLPPQKQTYFFDRRYEQGIAWYLGQFAGAGPEHRAIGEVATGYCLPHAVERMARHLPHVKIVLAMRHPIERAYSNFSTRRAEEGWPSFEAALEADEDLLLRGRYIEQVEALLEHYPRERLLPVLYDDLVADDRSYLRSILTFLEVDPGFVSGQIGQRRNAADWPRLRRALHRVGLKPTLAALSRSRAGDAIRRVRRRRGRRGAERMDPATRARLAEYFEPLNRRLAAFLQRDLSAWGR